MTKITEAQQRKITALQNDFEYYAPLVLQIRAKAGDLQRFELNAAQKYLHAAAQKQLAEKGRVRIIVLKGRQQGISTYIEGRLYWRVTQRKGVRAYILTHEAEATSNLFDMAQRFYSGSPEQIRPPLAVTNAKEMVFDILDSGYKVGTAGTKGVGRSSTIQYFHGSEVSFWPHAETHLTGILQAVPDEPGTEVYLESTANGVGGVFHDYWQKAIKGESEYVAVFIPWLWQPEYRKVIPGFEPTTQEQVLAKIYNLDNEQLAWRRSKIGELGGEDQFKQEYPCNESEAFLFSGRSVFDREQLILARPGLKDPLKRVEIFPTGAMKDHATGDLRVWKEPVPGIRYVIGADVSEGLPHGDFSCADVLDARTGEQVAQWHGKTAPDLFGDVLYYLGMRYNKALMGVERNNHGIATIIKLRDRKYPNLYVQADVEGMADDHPLKKLGWVTTQKSKFRIIDQLASELRDKDHGIRCKETIDEMRVYVIDEQGRYGAAEGLYDDRVMSRAIAGEMMRSDQARKVVSAHSVSGGNAAGWT